MTPSKENQQNFKVWMQMIQHRTESALGRFLPQETLPPQRLHSAMRYVSLGGGKRVRPLLTHAAGAMFNADPELLDSAASAVEFIHAYSLVHDDLPCMDNDDLRRGKPTCHIAFDEATAMLVGDALQSLAFDVLANSNIDSASRIRMVQELAKASGSFGMAGGQAVDLDATGQNLTLSQLEFMHRHKTGALIRAALLLGAFCGKASAESLHELKVFADKVGLLFQVVDDILDAESSTTELGKTAGKDAAQHKSTYVNLLGLTNAKEKAETLRREAHTSLSSIGTMVGTVSDRLHQLTDFIVDRTY